MKMMTMLTAVLSLVLGASVAYAGGTQADNGVQIERALSSDQMVVIMATSDLCAQCDTYSDQLERLAPWVADTISIGALDIQHYPSLAEQYRIHELGSLYLFKQGRPIGQLPLGYDEADIQFWLKDQFSGCHSERFLLMGGCDAHTFEVMMEDYSQESIDALFEAIHLLAEEYAEYDVKIEGDTSEGVFSMKVPLLGSMEGEYYVTLPQDREDYDAEMDQGALLKMQVTKKPGLLSCKTIDKLVDTKMGEIGDSLGIVIKRYEP